MHVLCKTFVVPNALTVYMRILYYMLYCQMSSHVQSTSRILTVVVFNSPNSYRGGLTSSKGTGGRRSVGFVVGTDVIQGVVRCVVEGPLFYPDLNESDGREGEADSCIDLAERTGQCSCWRRKRLLLCGMCRQRMRMQERSKPGILVHSTMHRLHTARALSCLKNRAR